MPSVTRHKAATVALFIVFALVLVSLLYPYTVRVLLFIGISRDPIEGSNSSQALACYEAQLAGVHHVYCEQYDAEIMSDVLLAPAVLVAASAIPTVVLASLLGWSKKEEMQKQEGTSTHHPPPERKPETGVGSEAWETNRLREIRELREEERKKATWTYRPPPGTILPAHTRLPYVAVLSGFLCATIEYAATYAAGVYAHSPPGASDFVFWDSMPVVSCVVVAFLLAHRIQFRGWPDAKLFGAVAAGTGALVSLAAFLFFSPRVSISELLNPSFIRFGGLSWLLFFVVLGGLYAGFPASIAGTHRAGNNGQAVLLFVLWMIVTFLALELWPLGGVTS